MGSLPACAVGSHIFREYIGATNPQIELKSVPNLNLVPFHFALAFATDYDDDKQHKDGEFRPQWTATFTPEIISEYRTTYDNAKILLSIGWYDDTKPFAVTNKDEWISNAKSSIKGIINDYNLEGLDVNYSKIDKDAAIFAECVGEVIKELKDHRIITIVSISPRADLNDHYSALYSRCEVYINSVNYQFYAGTDKILDTIRKLADAIDHVKKTYDGAKIAVGYSTDKADKQKNIPNDVLFLTYNQKSKELSGLSVWSADKSAKGYSFEKEAQKKLLEIYS